MTPVIPDVKAIRTALGLTQKAMADLLDVEPNTVYRWENGSSRPTKRGIRALERLSRDAEKRAKRQEARA